MISWIADVKGIIIALGFILPGVSGGVLAAGPPGIYEQEAVRFQLISKTILSRMFSTSHSLCGLLGWFRDRDFSLSSQSLAG